MITKKRLAKEWLIFLGCIVSVLLLALCQTVFFGALGGKDFLLGFSFLGVDFG